MSVHTGYVGAQNCTTGPQPGAKALMAAFLGLYAAKGGTNLGIFNCRAVRGSTTTTSLHGEGRACDFGINPHGAAWGTALAEVLRAFSAELGIQCVIWDRRIWSGAKPTAGWRSYSGTNPHRDHIHVELTWAAARALTAETAHRHLATHQEDDMALSPSEAQMLRDIHHELTFRLPNRRGPDGEERLEGGFRNDTILGYAANADGYGFRVDATLGQVLDAVTDLAARTSPPRPSPSGGAALSEADVQRIAKAVIAVLGNTPPSGLAQVYEFTGTATPKDPA